MIQGWHLDIAELIRKHMEAKEQEGTDWNHAGFVLMNLLFTYFEMIAQYKSGKSSVGASKDMFCEGLDGVYPGKFSQKKRKLIFSRIRCGMHHNAFIKKSVLISGNYLESISAEDDGKGHTLIRVNPHLLSPELNAYFCGHIKELKDSKNTTSRNNFNVVFDS